MLLQLRLVGAGEVEEGGEEGREELLVEDDVAAEDLARAAGLCRIVPPDYVRISRIDETTSLPRSGGEPRGERGGGGEGGR